MNIIVLLPRVVSRYVASFPEVTNNAYKYFNYDHRVVQERVERGDQKAAYIGPNDLNDNDYANLVDFAKSALDKTLARYSMDVACEDALHKAIKSYGNGIFDSKINSSRYNVLLCDLKKKVGITPSNVINYRHATESVEAKKKREDKETKVLHPRVLKELGLSHKDIPNHYRVRKQKGVPQIVRTDKGLEVRKGSDNKFQS
jgi:predicted metal-dependent hydrolase